MLLDRDVTDSLWTVTRDVLATGASGLSLVDAVVLLGLLHVGLHEHVDPLASLEVEGGHVVELVGHLVDASEHNHVALVNRGTVATPAHDGHIRPILHLDLDLLPAHLPEVKCPQIEQLIIII